MFLANLAENPLIITAAYIAAFLPWTAFSAKDFISAKWKTVRTTRREGYINLIFSIVPAGYILFYCVTQAEGKEFPEMAAAVVAMLFALLHASRTTWGLWQLNYFRHWCKTSIDALDAMGIEYRLVKTQYTDAAQIADRMLVNDSVIDNQLLHGNTLCFLRYGIDTQQSHDVLVNQRAINGSRQRDHTRFRSRGGGPLELRMPRLRIDSYMAQRLQKPLSCMTLPTLFWDYIEFSECLLIWIVEFSYFAALFVFFCSVAFVDVIRYSLGLKTSGKINQVPLQPEEVWLNWSVVFAAQGLQKWISSFNVAPDPDDDKVYNQGDTEDIREQRTAYFASEVLASAVMQLWPELSNSSATSTSPFFWNLWNKDSHMAQGRLVKDELLKSAVLSGRGLPFGVPHALKRLTQRRKNCVSYRIYHRHLSSVKAGLSIRDEFCSQIDDFNVEKLEWLTIILNLGNVALQHQMNTIPDSDDSDLTSEIIEDQRRRSRSPTEGVSQAIANLRAQLNWFSLLGHDTVYSSKSNSKRTTGRVSTSLFLPLSFPMSWGWESLISSNRHVLKVGEMIDVWLSLSAGDGVLFLLEVNPIWKDISKGLLPNYTNSPQESASSPRATGTETSQTDIAAGHRYDLREVHKELEQRRLRYHFADEKYFSRNLNQFMTFMGYRMESVRTTLAQWLYQNKERFSESNPPPLEVKIDSMRIAYRCKISTELSTVMRGKDVEVALKSRCVQSRLVWELQEQIQEDLRPEFDEDDMPESPTEGPGSSKTILQCILSYPSLHIKTEIKEYHEPGVSQYDSRIINLEQSNEDQSSAQHKDDSFKTVEVSIVPLCAPQDCAIVLRFHSNDPYHRLVTSMAIKWNDRSTYFKWELWRDAFIGRLEGREKWRKDHFARDVNLFVSSGKMDSSFSDVVTPTGESFPVWKGWMPFRFEFCKFEVENSGLLKQQLRVRNQISSLQEESGMPQLVSILSGTKQHIVRYEDVQSRVLKHAMLLIRGALPSYALRLQRIDGDRDNLPDSQEDLLALADRLSKETECDIERVALLYESAALDYGRVDEGREPLSKCIDFLFAHEPAAKTPRRIVNVLTRYMSTVLPEGERSTSKLSLQRRKTLLEVAYPACEKLVRLYGLCLGQEVDEKLFRCLLLLQLCDRSTKNTENIRSLMEVILVSSRSSTYLLPTYADSYGYPAERDSDPGVSATRAPLPVKEDFRVKYLILDMAVKYLPRDRDVLNSLAKLLATGACGVRRDAPRAKELYERAILEDQRALMAGRIISGDKTTIESGHIDAMYNFANLLAKGAPGVPQNAPRAVRLYERAIEVGVHAGAMCKLASLLNTGAPGVPVDAARAATLYQRAIEEGNRADAMYYLANLLAVGATGVNVNFERAAQYLELSVSQYGNTDAMVALAWLLSSRSVWCTEAHATKAVELLERAIKEEGRLDAMYYLGKLLSKGYRGVGTDAARAFELFEIASNEGGRTEAMVSLALLLTTGAEGVGKDVRRAVGLYERAISEGGRTDAMYNLALLLAHGDEGVPANPKRAVDLFNRAIHASGRTDAMMGLAWLLTNGAEGVPSDAPRAVELYQQAIEREGNLYAIHNLANILTLGMPGVAVDRIRAAKLLEEALRVHGDERTMFMLWKLRKEGGAGLAPNPRGAEQLETWARAQGRDLVRMEESDKRGR
eukprot:TRINITY_DN378_c0_g1_i1.p1 TRINITY_DN378_c0_g1~~TRINITY_DN378_c0_g1_i1.p1  ORF type:complete len:1671 (-),score=197.94 TRINITY_DN378_c0_g1_i1:6821-11833(-)